MDDTAMRNQAIITAFLYSGADWRAAVENLRGVGGTEYDAAAEYLRERGESFDRTLGTLASAAFGSQERGPLGNAPA